MRLLLRLRGLTFLFFCASAPALGACGESSPGGDAGIDDAGGGDAGGDAGGPGDAGSDGGQDAGPSCLTGCDVVELGLGSEFSCARRENGSVRCWGRGMEGQLGDDNMRHAPRCPIDMTNYRDCSARPTTVVLDGPVTSLSSGSFSSCAVEASGQVQCWGDEGWRIAGMVPGARFAPEPFPGLTSVDAVSDGSVMICAIGTDGSLACGGSNYARQTGTGQTVDVLAVPEPVVTEPLKGSTGTPLAGVLEVATGTWGSFACARTADTVYCWGSDSAGQLGTGVDYPMDCTASGSLVTYDCSQWAQPVSSLDATRVAQLALGGSHACARMTDGTVECWGDNRAGQLGTTDGDERGTPAAVPGVVGVTHIAAGSSFTCAVIDTGEVMCWGYNRSGQLGDGLESHGRSCVLDTSDVGDCSSTPVTLMGVDDAEIVEAGSRHACVTRAGGAEVWCWGANEMLQLGNGPNRTPMGDELLPSYAPVMVIGL